MKCCLDAGFCFEIQTFAKYVEDFVYRTIEYLANLLRETSIFLMLCLLYPTIEVFMFLLRQSKFCSFAVCVDEFDANSMFALVNTEINTK